MSSDNLPPPPKSDFLAAEEIRSLLEGRDVAEQERIIRWVGESLGLELKHHRSRHDRDQPHQKAETPDGESDGETSSQGTESPRLTDIRTFMRSKQPNSDVQFATATAYYYRLVAPAAARKESITTEDLQSAARLSQRAVFKSPSVTLGNAVKQGYMDRGGGGAYKLNTVGENLVSMTLPSTSEGTPKSSSTKARKRKPDSTKKAKRPPAKK